MNKALNLSFVLVFLSINLSAQGFWSPFINFGSGFLGPVYRTDGDLTVKDVNENSTYRIAAGLKYRILNENKGIVYLKVLPSVYRNDERKIMVVNNETPKADNSNKLLFYKPESDFEVYEKVWQQGLHWSTLVLPIKYRPETEFNGSTIGRVFSTDISVGPFFGYRFAIGKRYNNWLNIGGFAGPSLIQFTETTNTGQGSSSTSTDNYAGFTYGMGCVAQIEKYQIGLILGRDIIGGNKQDDWPYDNKTWLSLALGFSFLSNK